MTRRVILDTDTAQDDCFALLALLRHPAAHLEAVTVVAGNVDFDQQVHNALVTLQAAGAAGTVPIYLGCRAPLVRERVPAVAHGDGKGWGDFPLPDQRPEPTAAAVEIVRRVDAEPGRIDLVAIGPLTNIATALALDPDLPHKVRRLVVMGGLDHGPGNITPAAEYNVYVDPEAAHAVLTAGFDLTLVTWTLTLAAAVWSPQRLAEVASARTPLADFFTVVNRPTLEFNLSRGIPGSTHPDSLAAFVLLEPDLVLASSRARADVECAGALTRGAVVLDRTPWRPMPDITVVDEVDAAGFARAMDRVLGVSGSSQGHPRTR